jgi:hypothetical protein
MNNVTNPLKGLSACIGFRDVSIKKLDSVCIPLPQWSVAVNLWFKVVEYPHRQSTLSKPPDQMRTDESCTTSNQNFISFHRFSS